MKAATPTTTRSPAVGAPPPAASPSPDAAWRELRRAARAPYRRAGRFAWHFAEGKLSRDPVFRGLLERGDVPPRARLLDIGCGQGLLASLLRSAGAAQAQGRWPSGWGPAPAGVRYTGIELMPRDVARAQAALGGAGPAAAGGVDADADTDADADATAADPPRFICADMRAARLPGCDVAVILDVLHYVEPAAQDAVLRRVRDALLPRGRLLLRIGDAASRPGFAASRWVDRIVSMLRGHRVAPTFGRPADDWVGLLQTLGFAVRRVPMSRGTPFANVLLVADLA